MQEAIFSPLWGAFGGQLRSWSPAGLSRRYTVLGGTLSICGRCEHLRAGDAGGTARDGELTAFITVPLKLKVNQQKSAVARLWERKFLRFSFTNAKKSSRPRIASKAIDRLKKRIRELTRRTRAISHREDGGGTLRLPASRAVGGCGPACPVVWRLASRFWLL
jgi:hypothetical protein